MRGGGGADTSRRPCIHAHHVHSMHNTCIHPQRLFMGASCMTFTTPHCLRQDAALSTFRGAALLAHDILQQCHSQPPEDLQATAAALHDHGLLVGSW